MPILAKETDIYPLDLLDDHSLEQDAESHWWAFYTRSRREKQLARKIAEANELAGDREDKAKLALDHGNEDLARRLLSERVDALKRRDALTQELEGAGEIATQLKADLVRIEGVGGVTRCEDGSDADGDSLSGCDDPEWRYALKDGSDTVATCE